MHFQLFSPFVALLAAIVAPTLAVPVPEPKGGGGLSGAFRGGSSSVGGFRSGSSFSSGFKSGGSSSKPSWLGSISGGGHKPQNYAPTRPKNSKTGKIGAAAGGAIVGWPHHHHHHDKYHHHHHNGTGHHANIAAGAMKGSSLGMGPALVISVAVMGLLL